MTGMEAWVLIGSNARYCIIGKFCVLTVVLEAVRDPEGPFTRYKFLKIETSLLSSTYVWYLLRVMIPLLQWSCGSSSIMYWQASTEPVPLHSYNA